MMRIGGLCLVLCAGVGLAGCDPAAPGVAQEQEFSPYVSAEGTISIPANYRTEFAFLGAWSVAGDEEGGGAKELHTVYTQKATVETYRETGEFPDGAVLVKELLGTETGDMTTGHVSRATQTVGWFVMVRDSQGRFPDNSLWGDGWGWSFFEGGRPGETVSTDYKADCIGCHVPAQQTDWVYVQGYPALNP